MDVVWTVGLVVLVGIIAVAVWRFRPKPIPPSCPFCDSLKVREIGRDTAGVTTYQRHSGSPGGGTETMVQSHTKIKFTCEKCGQNFEKTVTQTR